MKGSPDTVALVGEQPIKAQEFQREYDRQLQYYSRIFGGKALTSKQIKTFGIQKNALQKLVNTKLMLLLADRLKIIPSEDEVKKTIKDLPYFKSGENFDIERYKQLLSQNRMTPTDFEQGVIVDLKLKRVGELITNSPLSQKYLAAITELRSRRLEAQLIKISKRDIADKKSKDSKQAVKLESKEAEKLSREVAQRIKKSLEKRQDKKVVKIVKKYSLQHNEKSTINRLDGNTKMIALNEPQVKELFSKATDKQQVALLDSPSSIIIVQYRKDNSPWPKPKPAPKKGEENKPAEESESELLQREVSSRFAQQINQELLKQIRDSVKVKVFGDLI